MKRILALTLASVLFCGAADGAVRSITEFGAKPNDGADDRRAIQEALNALGPNDVLGIPAGEFNLSDSLITNKSNFSLVAAVGGKLKGVGSDGMQLQLKGDNVSVIGVEFEGGGLFLDKPGDGRNHRIIIDWCRFSLNVTRGTNRSAITFTSGLVDSSITNCFFTGYNGSFAIYGYNYRRVKIANCEMVNITAGMHIDAFGDCGDILVEQIYLAGMIGMGLEFQGTAENNIFQDCWYEKPNNKFSGNKMAWSLILDKSKNITTRRMISIMPTKDLEPTGYVRIIFELGGDNSLVEDCYSEGGNHIVAMNDGVGTASVRVQNNRFKNFAQGISNSFPTSTRTLVAMNNSSTMRLSDVMEARLANGQRPGIGNKRYGTQPAPPSVILAPAADTTVQPGQTLTAKGTGKNLSWLIDRTNDGQPEISTGTGDSIGFTVPADSTTQHQIRITLAGDGGEVVRHLSIVAPAPVPGPDVAELESQLTILRKQLADQTAAGVEERSKLQTQNDQLRTLMRTVGADLIRAGTP